MFRSLTSKINALFKISEISSFKTRKLVATGLILSTVTYIIQVYGGCSGYLLDTLQVLQNKAARCVTQLPWRTPTTTLLTQCGWLSIRQLVMFHSLVLLFKVKMDRKLSYIYKNIGDQPGRSTRQESSRTENHQLKEIRNLGTETARRTFVPRSIHQWNSLPLNLREVNSIAVFKKSLKLWTKETITIK